MEERVPSGIIMLVRDSGANIDGCGHLREALIYKISPTGSVRSSYRHHNI
jgi:hypothetical protein